ncbi:carbohydrate kinase family protein [Candidatus Woesearchaeota archaeon]|nr:carbohydrate kinase family protein [Candidatus Woesearchaeota archaeon]
MKYEVITIGSISTDIFMVSHSNKIELLRVHGHEDLAVPVGGKVLVEETHTAIGGGGANCAVSFSRLGFRTAYLGKAGADKRGDELLTELRNEKVTFLGPREGETGLSCILSGIKNRTIFSYRGTNNNLRASEVPWKKLDAQWFYLGSLLGESWKTSVKIAKYALREGIPLSWNPSIYLCEMGTRKLKPVLDACKILILNKEEAQALSGTNKQTSALLRELHKLVPLVVITDGPNGADSFDGKEQWHIMPKDVTVVEPTGAGDSFASAFVAAHLLGKDVPTCLRWGAAQANSVIQHFGSTHILLNRREIERAAKKSGKLTKNQ